MENDTYIGAMPFLEHIRELRRRLILSVILLILGTVAGFVFYEYYQPFLFEPLGDLKKFKHHSLKEPFMIMVRISFYFGIVITIPMHLYNIVAFLMPALTKRERKMGAYLLPASTVLALAGAGMAYFYIVPWAVEFLQHSSFNPLGIEPVFSMTDAMDMIVKTLLAFMFLLQTPLLLLILMALNIVSRRTLLRMSRYTIAGTFIVAAIVTPPDWPSQVALAVPLILLYFLAIFIAKIMGFGKSPDDEPAPEK